MIDVTVKLQKIHKQAKSTCDIGIPPSRWLLSFFVLVWKQETNRPDCCVQIMMHMQGNLGWKFEASLAWMYHHFNCLINTTQYYPPQHDQDSKGSSSRYQILTTALPQRLPRASFLHPQPHVEQNLGHRSQSPFVSIQLDQTQSLSKLHQ